MFKLKLTEEALKAVENSPCGIAHLDVLESLRLCGKDTLHTTLSRLSKEGRLIRLKKGVYSANPIRDAYCAAQETFGGYLGFASALHIHGIADEIPFTIHIITPSKSARKGAGSFEFVSVALHEKAVGFEKKGSYTVSTRAKTLFDCLYLPRYFPDRKKLALLFRQARLSWREWNEFDGYVERFANGRGAGMKGAKKLIRR